MEPIRRNYLLLTSAVSVILIATNEYTVTDLSWSALWHNFGRG